MSTIDGISVYDVRVERAHQPWGIDVDPRISWKVGSTSNGTTVLDASVTVLNGGRVLWETRVAHPTSSSVECPLSALESDQSYDVVVRITTNAGSAEAATTFRTGLLHDDDWGGATWIAAPAELGGAAPLMRAEFSVPTGARNARVYLAAGGIARVHINGKPASTEVLGPGFTAYDHRVQYLVWNVSELVHDGPNAIAIELGRGFFAMSEPNIWQWEASPWSGTPRLRLTLIVDNTVVLASGDRFSVIDGPTRYDNLYGGETFDARLDHPGASIAGFVGRGWMPAARIDAPAGRLVHRRQQPIEVIESLSGTLVSRHDGRLILDFGRVVAGWVRVEVNGDSGQRIDLRYGEKLTNGRPNDDDEFDYYSGRFQHDVLILAGHDVEVWETRFGWKGFRFVEVTGWPVEELAPGAIIARVVHNAVDRTGHFEASDEGMTAVHALTVQTILNNLHSIPTDTPKYEKNGWTADGMVGTEMFLLNLDTHELLAKWVDDISDSRDERGIPAVIAPRGGWTYDWNPAPPWHAAYVMIPWWLYRYGGDTRVLTDHFDGIVQYLSAEFSRAAAGIATTTLGDWVSPETPPAGGNPPEDLRVSGTAYLYAMLTTAVEIGRVLDRDTTRLASMAEVVRRAFLATFFDADAGVVRGDDDRGYRQSHNVLALAHGLIDPSERQRVADSIAHDVVARGNHLNTGVLATKYLLPVLTEFGYADVAVALARQTTFPSWGYWVELGATSLWEHWHEDARSQGHYFLGTIDDWFYGYVAGIRTTDVAFRRVLVKPAVMGVLDAAAAEVESPFGRVAVSWRVTGRTGILDLTVPVGVTADVELPGEAITEVGHGEHRFTFEVSQHTVGSGAEG